METMTRYQIASLTWKDVWSSMNRIQYYPYMLRNRQTGEVFTIEGDSAGFVQLAICFLMIAAEGFYAHLESRERVPSNWMFESGVPVKIGDSTGRILEHQLAQKSLTCPVYNYPRTRSR